MSDLADDFPGWTEFDGTSDEHRGQYPLGIDAVGMGIVAQRLLPGITNATRRARYYSILSWIAVESAERATQKGTLRAAGKDQAEWLRRLEALFRAASLENDEQTPGLVGIDGAIRTNGLGTRDTVALTEGDPATAFEIAAYGASFAFLGLGDRQEAGRVIRASARAQELAAAFKQSVGGKLKTLTSLLDGDWRRSSVGAIRDLSEAVALRPLQSGTAEYEKVRDLIFRGPPVVGASAAERIQVARSRTLGLLLQIIESNSHPTDEDTLHAVFGTGILPGSGKPFRVAEAFERESAAWLRYEERQVLKFGLYGLWYEFTDVIETSGRDRLRQQLIHTEFLRALGATSQTKATFGANGSGRVGPIMERLYARASMDRAELGGAAEPWLESLVDSEDRGERILACLCLILLAARHWELKSESMSGDSAALHRRGSRARLCLESVASDIRQRADWTVAELLEWLVDTYVCAQSLRFALAKLRNGQYRFFVERDEEGYRVVKSDASRGYLRRDADRLRGALGLLHDLGMTTDPTAPQITTVGKAWWRQLAKLHS